MKKLLTLFLSVIFITNTFGQIPAGYYNNAEGLTATPLRQALHQIIDNHSAQSYSSLWFYFKQTDKRSNEKVWDIYSDVPNGTPPYYFTFNSDQCGNYNSEGDCYNREHSWPKSWFNNGTPMYTDLFHIYPTDGYVNSRRSNYPYGITNNPFWTSQNGSKVGPASFSTMSGTVFEPIDEYKGDLARTYFYMCTRYYGEDSGWQSNQLVNGANLTTVGVELLLMWSEEDPVSQKEIDRNNAIYQIQHNRNPYIDHPEYAEKVWGAINTPPRFATILSDTSVMEGNVLIFNIKALDNDSTTLSISQSAIFSDPQFVTFTDLGNGNGKLVIAPSAGDMGNYQLVLSASDGVNTPVEQTFYVNVLQGNGISTILNQNVAIAPNPAINSFNLTFTNFYYRTAYMSVYSVDGKEVESRNINTRSTFNFGESYKNGVYLLRLITPLKTYNFRIVKQ